MKKEGLLNKLQTELKWIYKIKTPNSKYGSEMSVEGIRVAFVPGGAAPKPGVPFECWQPGIKVTAIRFVNTLSRVFTQKCQRALSTTKRLIHSKINYFQNRDCG